jgi:hypothetical protein
MDNHAAAAASWKQSCSTCEEEACMHDGTTCHEDFMKKRRYHHHHHHDHGPLALLYRARHYTPFTDPFTVFEQAFGGRAIFERPKQQLECSSTLGVLPLQYNKDWECRHTSPIKTAAATWTRSTKIEKDGSIVHMASRTLHGIQITKTETKTVDKEGKTRIHIQVTRSEPAMIAVCARRRQEALDDFSCSQIVGCCRCTTKMNRHNNNNNNTASQDDDELSLCSWPELSELSSPCKNWLFPPSSE